MQNDYSVLNIHEYLAEGALIADLQELIESFDCSEKNVEVDQFLKNNAIEFAKKGQSVTYFVFSDSGYLVGYFTLAIKPITVLRDNISNKFAKKLERVCCLDSENNTYHLSAYLIAQLGKNLSLSEDKRIDGQKLLSIAEAELGQIKSKIGGVAVFLECEDVKKLVDFYEASGYKNFGERVSDASKGSPVKYLQYLKMI